MSPYCDKMVPEGPLGKDGRFEWCRQNDKRRHKRGTRWSGLDGCEVTEFLRTRCELWELVTCTPYLGYV